MRDRFALFKLRILLLSLLVSGIFVLMPLSFLSADKEPGRQKTDAVSIPFKRDIQPLLETHCLSCHGSEKPESGFSLTSRKSALPGGNYGTAIIPGKPDQSPLLLMISGTHQDEIVMPPEGEGERLSSKEVAAIRQWIREGANWPDALVLGAQSKQRKLHWSFQPINNPELPVVQNENWFKNEIDHFILHRLEQEKSSPSEAADKATLIRRITLDLTGLPPTPAEVDQFLNDSSPEAYERVVERLLASPRFGEKWARHWLDLCHYADSDGYLTDAVRPHAWRYRDWVVNSLNENKPFDQFTIE